MTDLDEFRRDKDEFFRTDEHSPLSAEQRRDFHGLRYYHEAPALAFAVTPEPFEVQERIEMQTSTGDTAEYIRWARLPFEVDGQPQALTVLRDAATGALFLPFQDANAGRETYGAGRYLELPQLEDGRVLLDFNYAYNPYCAYNECWSCPLPPPENRLLVAIRAGEMTFEDGH